MAGTSTANRRDSRQPWALAAAAVALMLLILRTTHRAYAGDAGALSAWSAVTLAVGIGAAGSLLVVQRASEMQALSGLQRWFLGAALAVSPFMVGNATVTLGEPMWTLWAAFVGAVVLLLGWTAWHVRTQDGPTSARP